MGPRKFLLAIPVFGGLPDEAVELASHEQSESLRNAQAMVFRTW